MGDDDVSTDSWQEKTLLQKLLAIITMIPGIAFGVWVSSLITIVAVAIPFGLLVYIFHINVWISAVISFLMVAAIAVGYAVKVKINDDGVLLTSAGLVVVALLMGFYMKMNPIIVVTILSLPISIVGIWYQRRGKETLIVNNEYNINQEKSYGIYLASEHWKTTRLRALENAGYKCQLCSRRKEPLNVHHNSYEHLGNELDSDLIVLCRDCHHKYHKKSNLK